MYEILLRTSSYRYYTQLRTWSWTTWATVLVSHVALRTLSRSTGFHLPPLPKPCGGSPRNPSQKEKRPSKNGCPTGGAKSPCNRLPCAECFWNMTSSPELSHCQDWAAFPRTRPTAPAQDAILRNAIAAGWRADRCIACITCILRAFRHASTDSPCPIRHGA